MVKFYSLLFTLTFHLLKHFFYFPEDPREVGGYDKEPRREPRREEFYITSVGGFYFYVVFCLITLPGSKVVNYRRKEVIAKKFKLRDE